MKTKHVVFVCVENSCRSQIAEGYGHLEAPEGVVFYSSGSRPSGLVNPKAIAAMAEIGYDLSAHQSKGLADLPQVEFEYAITMGCGDECPMLKARHREDWGLPDPKHMAPEEFAQVRDKIGEKVKALIKRLNS